MRLKLIPALLVCALPVVVFGQKKEVVELGRDLAQLQEEVRSNHRATADRLSNMEATLKAIQDQIASTSRSISVLDSGLKERMEKSVAGPISGVGNKVENLSQDFGYIRETVAEINTRLGKLQQKVVDLENTIKTMQAPPAPPATPLAAAPSSNTPPPGVSSKGLYDDAMRDKSGGNFDLALKGFSDYLAWFGDTDLAPNAQYYVGEIYYTQKDFEPAAAAFDKVIENYAKNSKTLDAHLMKGRALVKLDRRGEAEKEFRAIISAAPGSDVAGRAKTELANLGLSTGARPRSRR